MDGNLRVVNEGGMSREGRGKPNLEYTFEFPLPFSITAIFVRV